MRYDEIISLGYNCEVSFRIKEHYNRFNSFLYSWSYIMNRDKFNKSLRDLNKIEFSENKMKLLTSGMFENIDYGIAFHSKMSKYQLFNSDGTTNIANVDLALKEMGLRYTYLTQKLFNILNDKSKMVLFVCKMQPWKQDINDNRIFIEELYRSLSEVSQLAHFTLLIMQEKTESTLVLKKLEAENLIFRYVDMFADDSDTKHGGDVQGWNNILDEFKLK